MFNSETLARELEETAVLLARGAGEILSGHFGRQISIQYKDQHDRDPVTAVDKAAQEYLVTEIAARFPDHGILGEEDADDSESPAPDFLWVLDPLDGTTNFINGLPVYACSVGLLYRGGPWQVPCTCPGPSREAVSFCTAARAAAVVPMESRFRFTSRRNRSATGSPDFPAGSARA